MTTSEIYSAIGERVDDPDKSQYSARYENVFIQAMTELIKLRDENGFFIYPSEEFPELTESNDFEAIFSNSWVKKDFSDISNLMLIRDIFTDPDVSIITNVTQKRDFAELQRMLSNKYLIPSGTEIFWAKKGNSVFIISNITKDVRLSADIILNPNPTSWGTQDLVATLHYGRGFINSCITRAAQILRAEIGLE